MLIDKKILSGFISFNNQDDDIEEGLLFQAVKQIKDIINKHFDFVSYNATCRNRTSEGSLYQIVMNDDELHTNEFNMGDSVMFYSHSSSLDIGNIVYEFVDQLERLVEPSIYNGLSINFAYNIIEFDSVGVPIISHISRVVDFSIGIDEIVTFEDKVLDKELIHGCVVTELLKRTNLLIFNDRTYLGIYHWYAHIGGLVKNKSKLFDLHEAENNMIPIVAKELSDSASFYSDFIITFDENLDNIVNLSKAIKGIMDEDYLIGEEKLMDYLDKVAPIIAKKLMTGEIRFNRN